MGMDSTYKLSVIVNMIDQLSGPSARVTRSINQTSAGFQSYTNQLGDIARNGTALIAVGQSVTKATMAPVKSIFGTQDALAELASLGVQDLGKLEGAARDFSRTWAGTTKAEFLTAAYDIKSGIASLSDQGVADMTRIAAITAKATKSTAAEMTSLFATGYGIYKDYYSNLSDLEFGEMFSGGIAKSVQQFKTTGSGMAQAISALGGSATVAAVPLEEQLAILGMLQATMSGSEAGTKYTAFLQNAARAGQELGLNFSDTNGQLLAMPQILGQIRGKFGDVMTVTDKMELQKAFGTVEAVKLIDLLYGKTDDLQGNIVTLYDTMGKGMSITADMANKINAPPGQSWALLTQKFRAATETVGNAMLPTFTKLQEVFSSLADWIGDTAERFPGLISGFMFSIMAMGVLYTVIGSLKLAFGGFGAAITGAWKLLTSAPKIFGALKYGAFCAKYGLFLLKGALSPLKSGFVTMAGSLKTATCGMLAWAKQGILSAAAALPGLIAGVWSFTAALLANPITWVVVAIVGLIAIIVLLWKNWDSVSAWISNTWSAVCAGVSSSIEWLKNGIGSIINWIGEKLAAFKNLGASILTSITDGIMSVASKPIEAVKGVFTKIREMLPFSDAKTGPLSDLTLSGQRVFTTFNDGMQMTAAMPSQTMEGAFGKVNQQMTGSAFAPTTRPENTAQEADKGKTTIIQKLVLYVKPSEIADLSLLKKLVEELQDSINSSGSDPVPEV